jgi:hypothetical protein
MEMPNEDSELDEVNTTPTRREILESFGKDYVPPRKAPEVYLEVGDEEWQEWASSVEIRLNRQNQIVIGVAAGLVLTLGFTVLMGRVVLKLVEGQKVIIQHLNGVDSNGNPLPQSASASQPRYSVPSNEVDTSKAAPIDEDLFADLKNKMDSSTQVSDLGENLQ